MSSIHLASSNKPKNITASDTAFLEYNGESLACRGISIGTAGNLAINDSEGNKVIIPGNTLAIGIIHPIVTDKIYSTGTTASEIVVYY